MNMNNPAGITNFVFYHCSRPLLFSIFKKLFSKKFIEKVLLNTFYNVLTL